MTKPRLILFLWVGILSMGMASEKPMEKMPSELKKATFGAGCFWGVEKIFSHVPGVVSTTVGYAGGVTKDPTYPNVCAGQTGHAEAVEVTYDPHKVSYEELLVTFWEWHDPTTLNQQGPDVGSQYRSVIFTHDEEQLELATQSKKILEESRIFSKLIETEILPAGPFYRAEEYHQKYLKKNPFGYCSHTLQNPRVRELLNGKLKSRFTPLLKETHP